MVIRIDETQVKLNIKCNRWQSKKKPNLSTWNDIILIDVKKRRNQYAYH